MIRSPISRSIAAVFLFAIALFAAGCAPSVSTTIENDAEPLEASKPVGVTDDPSIVEGEVVGSIRVKEAGLSINCSQADVWARMREEARKAGANVVLITESKRPDAWSSCYRAEADFYQTSTDVLKRVVDREPKLVREESGSPVWTVVGLVAGGVAGYLLASLLIGG